MPKQLTYEYVKSYIEGKGDTLVSLEYDNNKGLLDIVCGVCNQQYKQTLDRFNRGYQHQNCPVRLQSSGFACKKPVPANTIVCATCNKEFQPKRIETKFCSVECSQEALRSDELKQIAIQNTTIEEWKVIEKAKNYEISNFGKVRNKNTKKILTPTAINGYLSVGLRINNKTVTSFIHRLVAESFVLCSDETYVVNHKDGIKINNHLENLEWVSQSENGKHAYRINIHKPTRIKVSQYTLDEVFVKEYESILDAEYETGIYNGKISSVCRGVRKKAGGYIWKYTNYVPTTQPVPDGKIMTGYPNYIITQDGRVYNSQRKLFLTPSKNESGYMALGLSDGKKRANFTIHRLVASIFLENPNNYPDVNHKDCDKSNNSIENLEWISRSDNMKHMIKNRQVVD